MTKPKIRFKRDDGSDFPDWKQITFDALYEPLNNNTYSRDCLNYEGGDAKNIHYGDILVKFSEICDVQKEDLPFINKGNPVQKYASLRDGDIILADTAEDETVGKAVEIHNVNDENIISGLHTMVCRPRLTFAPKYLGYYMNSSSYHSQLKPYMQGIKVTSIGRKNIAETMISYPADEREQQLIADFLSNVDDVIATSEEEVANLERQKKSVMQKIFSQEVRFQKEDGSDFPDWEEKRLEDVLDYEQPTKYIVKDTNYNDDYLVPVLTAGQSLILGYTNEHTGVYNATKESPVIIFDDFTTSFHWIDFSFKVKSSAMKMLTLKNNDCVFKYVLNAMKNIEYLPQSHSRQWISTYSQFFIPYPSLPEQQLIADFFSSYDQAITEARQDLEKWKELKKSLLQQLFV